MPINFIEGTLYEVRAVVRAKKLNTQTKKQLNPQQCKALTKNRSTTVLRIKIITQINEPRYVHNAYVIQLKGPISM